MKFARVSAQYNASSAHLFAYFFWRNRKSRSAKQRLRCCCKRGTSGEYRTSGPMWASAPTKCCAELPAERSVAVLPQKGKSGEYRKRRAKSPAPTDCTASHRRKQRLEVKDAHSSVRNCRKAVGRAISCAKRSASTHSKRASSRAQRSA